MQDLDAVCGLELASALWLAWGGRGGAWLRSRSEAEPYRWLNTCFLIGEGEIDEDRENWWLDTYVCVNEQAQGPPALGSEPPERYRQRRAADGP